MRIHKKEEKYIKSLYSSNLNTIELNKYLIQNLELQVAKERSDGHCEYEGI
jgi:hypothetical protein